MKHPEPQYTEGREKVDASQRQFRHIPKRSTARYRIPEGYNFGPSSKAKARRRRLRRAFGKDG